MNDDACVEASREVSLWLTCSTTARPRAQLSTSTSLFLTWQDDRRRNYHATLRTFKFKTNPVTIVITTHRQDRSHSGLPTPQSIHDSIDTAVLWTSIISLLLATANNCNSIDPPSKHLAHIYYFQVRWHLKIIVFYRDIFMQRLRVYIHMFMTHQNNIATLTSVWPSQASQPIRARCVHCCSVLPCFISGARFFVDIQQNNAGCWSF